MRIGPSTEEPSTANPPIQRAITNYDQSQAMPLPKAETKYSTAKMESILRLPVEFDGLLASRVPMIVPITVLSCDITKVE